MHLRRDFQAQGVESDEAGGVVLIVGLRRVGFHRGVHWFIQTAVENLSRHAGRGRFQFHFPSDDKKRHNVRPENFADAATIPRAFSPSAAWLRVSEIAK